MVLRRPVGVGVDLVAVGAVAARAADVAGRVVVVVAKAAARRAVGAMGAAVTAAGVPRSRTAREAISSRT